MGWEARKKRTIVSEWHELETAPGVRVKVRKYSYGESSRIRQMQTELTARHRDFFSMLMTKYYDDVTEAYGEFDIQHVLAFLKDNGRRGEAVDLSMQLRTLEDDGSVDLVKVQLEAGLEAAQSVDEYDPGDDNPTWKDEKIAAFRSNILEFEDVVNEVIGLINQRNTPLASRTSAISGTSASSSIPETPTTDQETPTPTEPSPTS